jgi:hypothetical protein
VFLFFGEFSQPDDPPKKKGWRIQQMNFWDLKKNIMRQILTQKTYKSPDFDSVFL